MSSLVLSSDQINIRPAVMKRVNKDLLQTLLSGKSISPNIEEKQTRSFIKNAEKYIHS